MLFLSLQFLIWSISGVYMVVFDIDYIHGDSLINEEQSAIDNKQIHYGFKDLFIDYPLAENVELSTFMDVGVYRFTQQTKHGKTQIMLDANTGVQFPALNENMAIKLAEYYYQGKAKIAEATLLKDTAPAELSSRHLPVWRIDFDDFAFSTLYISSSSGKVVTRRHQFWRIFDLMFTLHVMDYEEGEPDNSLLLWFALFALLAVFSGMVLTYYRVLKGSFSKSKKRTAANHKHDNNIEQGA